ncbi:hypothetical protein [Fulvivirga sediminis]|uniref:Uncharacterized protein n=1 Tax=Fulvivirga sediminis TaxID=2803949 RepID=A0A937FD02_9BACT|nr:hypothetical protein [Fulvivirga sediminis]MBL3658949.1 hypothetical protein [Fulvivirga sediminis]
MSCDDDDQEVKPEEPQSLHANDDSFSYSNEEWLDLTEWEEANTYYATYDIKKLLENDELQGNSIADIEFKLVTKPKFGEINKSEQLLVFYFPNTEFKGEDTFEYEICKSGECSKAKVSIKVNDFKKPEEPEEPTFQLEADNFNYTYDQLITDHVEVKGEKVILSFVYELSEFLSEITSLGIDFEDIELELQDPSEGEVSIDSEGTITYKEDITLYLRTEYQATISYTVKYENQVYESQILINAETDDDWAGGW